MSPDSPKIASPLLGPISSYYKLLERGYFGDLVELACFRFYFSRRDVEQCGCLGGHSNSGPPSEAGTCWTAAAMNVPTSPTIRTEILIARFMGYSPISA
jgi:hypothetical protein